MKKYKNFMRFHKENDGEYTKVTFSLWHFVWVIGLILLALYIFKWR